MEVKEKTTDTHYQPFNFPNTSIFDTIGKRKKYIANIEDVATRFFSFILLMFIPLNNLRFRFLSKHTHLQNYATLQRFKFKKGTNSG